MGFQNRFDVSILYLYADISPMVEKDNKKKLKWYQKLRNKYRLVILNDETFEERLSFRLSRMNVFVFLGSLAIILVSLTIMIIAFTPLREFIPGYMDPEVPKRLYALQKQADSLEKDVERKTVYIENIRSIIEGNVLGDTVVQEANTEINYDTVQLQKSRNDSLFRAEYERENRYNLYIYEDDNPFEEVSLANLNFYAPLKGTVTNNFNLVENHYGIDLVSGSDKTVKATLDGTVILSDWTLETGYVIGIQHGNNFVSIYKHNSDLLKRIGNYVKAGEPIAIVGETGELSTGPHLHFELWFNGAPVNPRDYITF